MQMPFSDPLNPTRPGLLFPIAGSPLGVPQVDAIFCESRAGGKLPSPLFPRPDLCSSSGCVPVSPSIGSLPQHGRGAHTHTQRRFVTRPNPDEGPVTFDPPPRSNVALPPTPKRRSRKSAKSPQGTPSPNADALVS